MILVQHPQRLSEIAPIYLANYRLAFGYSLTHTWANGRVQLRDGSIFYGSTRESAERVRSAAAEPDWYNIVQHCFIVYGYPNDPHAFCIDGLKGEFDTLRVQLYSIEEADSLIVQEQLHFMYQADPKNACESPVAVCQT